jgi:hypothetical protein
MKPPFVVKSHFGEKFKDEMPDDEWLKIVGARGWTVLSHDARFHLDSAALTAIKQFKVGCFYLWGGQVPVWDKVGLLTTIFPKIKKISSSEKRPYIYRAGANGRIHVVRHWDGRQEPRRHTRADPTFRAGGS